MCCESGSAQLWDAGRVAYAFQSRSHPPTMRPYRHAFINSGARVGRARPVGYRLFGIEWVACCPRRRRDLRLRPAASAGASFTPCYRLVPAYDHAAASPSHYARALSLEGQARDCSPRGSSTRSPRRFRSRRAAGGARAPCLSTGAPVARRQAEETRSQRAVRVRLDTQWKQCCGAHWRNSSLSHVSAATATRLRIVNPRSSAIARWLWMRGHERGLSELSYWSSALRDHHCGPPKPASHRSHPGLQGRCRCPRPAPPAGCPRGSRRRTDAGGCRSTPSDHLCCVGSNRSGESIFEGSIRSPATASESHARAVAHSRKLTIRKAVAQRAGQPDIVLAADAQWAYDSSICARRPRSAAGSGPRDRLHRDFDQLNTTGVVQAKTCGDASMSITQFRGGIAAADSVLSTSPTKVRKLSSMSRAARLVPNASPQNRRDALDEAQARRVRQNQAAACTSWSVRRGPFELSTAARPSAPPVRFVAAPRTRADAAYAAKPSATVRYLE